ncbi:TPA: hypothetical protein QHY55_003332 [Klebsiella pneumoniae subsp. pneumoniae]|nr:hypothetical protein [Klebsiella pneumoniae subsp. pneumoniae]
MAYLPEQPEWTDGVYQLEKSDPVRGGVDGPANRPLIDLLKRTAWLKQRYEEAFSGLGWAELGEWAVGLEVTIPSQIVHYQGYWYRYGGSLPHTITGASPSLDDNDNWFNLGNDVSLRANLGSSEPGMGVDLVHGARRYFKVTDYPGGTPDSSVGRKSDGTLTIIKGTNNTNAIKSAIADAQACNGVVYLPAPENGNAYLFDETLFPAVTSGALWRGASLQGDGKTATKIIFDGGDIPAVHVKGTSGWPTNIFLQGMSLYSATDFVGEGWKLQGITGIRLSDFAAYRFGGGLSFSNGSASGIFTEFNIVEDGWLENNNTNIKFRKDGGDGSFHGITLRNVISNNLPGQTGLDNGAGCVIYNADWNQVTFFGAAGVQWILNNGSRNGFETLYFEGNGTVTNNADWSTAGYWRIQSGTGVITDTSTIPFFNDGYITPTSPSDANFSAAGFTSVESLKPLINNQTYRGLMRLRGNNAEALAVTGYDSGSFESQGLAIVSQSLGDGIKDIILRQLIHLNGITSFRPEYRFNYVGGATQLSINSSGRHTGVMGRRTTGSISASASQQTITTDLVLPITNQSFMLSVHLYSADRSHRHVATYVGAAVTGSSASTALLITSHSDAAIAFPSASFVILDGGTLRFAVTTSVDISYEIKALGVGTY